MSLLPAVLFSILPLACIYLTFLWSGWLIRRELSPPLLADVVVPSLQLPGEMVNRRGLVFSGPVQLPDIVAVLGWVVRHGSILGAFLALQLQDGEDSSELTDHPVLKHICCPLTYCVHVKGLQIGASDFLNANQY